LQKRDSEAFDAFVRARLPDLLRFGRALTGSDRAGADLVQDALERTLVRWSRVDGDPEGYARRMMATRNIPAWRRLRGERSTTQVPEQQYDGPAVGGAPTEPVEEALEWPAAPGDADAVIARAHRGASSRRFRRTAIAAAAVLAVLTATGVLDSPGIPDAGPAKGLTSTPTPTDMPTTATERPGSTVPAHLRGVLGFDATAAGSLWRVDAAACGELLCAELLRQDGDAWVPEAVIEHGDPPGSAPSLPPVELVSVAPDGQHLWASGMELWSSHDAGATWQAQELAGDNPRDRVSVVPVGPTTFAVQSAPARLWRSPASSDDWVEVDLPRGFGPVDYAMALDDGLAVVTWRRSTDERVLLVGAGDGSWEEQPLPCQGPVGYVRSSGTALFLMCDSAEGYGTVVWRSVDGLTWSELARVDVPSYSDQTLPLDDGTVLVVKGRRGWLVTADGQVEVDLPMAREALVVYGEFVTPHRGYLLTDPPRRLLATEDGGRTWSRVG
jgi:DNA-directed RNA polymerase specialized sigma24 family protein